MHAHGGRPTKVNDLVGGEPIHFISTCISALELQLSTNLLSREMIISSL